MARFLFKLVAQRHPTLAFLGCTGLSSDDDRPLIWPLLLNSSQLKQEQAPNFHANTLNLPPQNYTRYIQYIWRRTSSQNVLL